MTTITQCPECATRFKVTEVQIEAHNGLVRCGRCHVVFNAREHQHDHEPSRQLSLPIDLETQVDAPPPDHPKPAQTDEEIKIVPEDSLTPHPFHSGLQDPTGALAQQILFVEELTEEVKREPSRIRRWTLNLVALLLTLILLAQATYFFRVDLAARLPGLKPQLTQYCTLLDCTITLPQRAELMVIESSELESDPKLANVVTLHALLHNHADYAQAFPNLELTLTDLQDHVIARRVFAPADYVNAETGETQGVAANRELDLKLLLGTSDLKPTGYRLFLFYPQ
jgi:predicted Zn finger-like uncharacterized protein